MHTVDADGSVWIDRHEAQELIGCGRHTLAGARATIRHRNVGSAGNGARYLYNRSDAEAFARAFRARRGGAGNGVEWLTAAQAQALIGCSRDIVRRNRHRIQHVRVTARGHGARYLYARVSVEAFALEYLHAHDIPDSWSEAMARADVGAEARAEAEVRAEVDIVLAMMEAERAREVPPAPSTPAACGHILAPLCGCPKRSDQ